MNKNLEANLTKLGLGKETIDRLKQNNVNKIFDMWCLKRSDLKEMGFNNDEINFIVIELQLLGLDLNKKIY